MSDVFGIDLGTTYSAISYINENGLPEIIRNLEGEETTPSVVYFENEYNSVVGQIAKNGAVVEPELTVSLIKRLMGQEYNVTYHGADHSPESISALILKELVAGARETTGVDSNRVVITVPAYFGVTEREATRQAGGIAALEVVGIVTEPVAAALSYQANQDGGKTIFVYDLGGGTFDTTILRTSGDSDHIDVIVVDGNRELGGADWDARLIQHIAQKFQSAAALDDDPLDDDDFRQRLTDDAETTKKRLSATEKAQVVLQYGSAKERIEVTREEFESITSDLLEMTMAKVEATLEAAREKDPDLVIDEVLLVGGSSKMPAVKSVLVARYPDWNPKLADPALAVAKGAALYGKIAGSDEASDGGADDGSYSGSGDGADQISRPRHIRSSTALVSNVLPKGLGVLFWDPETDTDYVEFLAHKNDDLPTQRLHQEALTSADNSTAIAVRIFEQGGDKESPRPSDNEERTPESGAMFTGLPSLPKGSPIDIYLTVDDEGLATLEAFEPTSGQQLHLEVKMAVMQAEEQVAATAVVSKITTRA